MLIFLSRWERVGERACRQASHAPLAPPKGEAKKHRLKSLPLTMSTRYRIIKTAEDLRLAVESLSAHQVIGLDTETTELDPFVGRLRLIQLATPSGVEIFDLDAFGDLRNNEALKPLKQLLAAARPIKIA